MRLAARSTIIAGAFAIAAIAAPTASARFDLEPQQRLSVNPSTCYATPVPSLPNQPTSPRPEVHANPGQQTTQTGPGVPPILRRVAASQLAAIDRAKEQALANHVPPTARFSNADVNAYATATHPVAAAAPTLKAPSNGFDWGDAAIGAGITAALAVLVTAGTLAMRQRSQPRHSS